MKLTRKEIETELLEAEAEAETEPLCPNCEFPLWDCRCCNKCGSGSEICDCPPVWGVFTFVHDFLGYTGSPSKRWRTAELICLSPNIRDKYCCHHGSENDHPRLHVFKTEEEARKFLAEDGPFSLVYEG